MLGYHEVGPLRRAIRQLVTARPVAAASAVALPPLDRAVLGLTRGRSTFSGWLTALPVVELATTGRRSGRLRTTFVLGIPDGSSLLVVAANFGSDSEPAWYRNLVADPRVSITHGGREHRMVAEPLDGVEREQAFEVALSLNPGWLRFRRRTGRTIGVARLREE